MVADPHQSLPPDPSKFAAIFGQPTDDSLFKLDAREFEGFVQYVFERAGYAVENTALRFGQGVDLKLYVGTIRGRPAACVSVKHHSLNHKVGQQSVRDFQQSLRDLGVLAGYLVTNTSFAQPALDQGNNQPRVTLVDGDHLRRYINYVRGTRLPNSQAPLIAIDPLFQADIMSWRDSSQTKVLTIANNKGGVGKTTTALYLAKRLADAGQRVLIVDLDSQANLTQTLPNPNGSAPIPFNLVDYFQRRAELHQLVRPTPANNVFLVPCHTDLRLALSSIFGGAGDELGFARDLHDQQVRPPRFIDNNGFDWIVIDTPPDMTFRTRAALAASQFVLAPAEPGPYPDTGLMQLFASLQAMRALTGRNIRFIGCLVTMWQNTRLQLELKERLAGVLKEAAETYGIEGDRFEVLSTEIPLDPNVVKDESSARWPLPSLGRKPASVRYTELAQEVFRYVSNS